MFDGCAVDGVVDGCVVDGVVDDGVVDGVVDDGVVDMGERAPILALADLVFFAFFNTWVGALSSLSDILSHTCVCVSCQCRLLNQLSGF